MVLFCVQADALMEAIDIYSQQTASKNDGLGVGIETPQHPLMVAYGAANDPERFLFIVFTGLRLPISGGGGLEHTLGSVHADHARRLLPRLVAWMERGWDVELCGRALRYLCTLHAGMVTADPTLSDVLSVAQTARQAYLSKTRVGNQFLCYLAYHSGLDLANCGLSYTLSPSYFEAPKFDLRRGKRMQAPIQRMRYYRV